jgi:hypothetical protein
MLSVVRIHQPKLIFSKSVSSELGNQCPLAMRPALFTVSPVLLAVPRHALA